MSFSPPSMGTNTVRQSIEMSETPRSGQALTDQHVVDVLSPPPRKASPDRERPPNDDGITTSIPKAENLWMVQQSSTGKLDWRTPDFRFDIEQLPADLQRVKNALVENGKSEEYALRMVFMITTAEHLHRAWNLTLLTSKVMKTLKRKFDLRMTWELGVLRLKFLIDDGLYELHRKVPYDYDSEYQDKFVRIAHAVLDGDIDIHRALQYQVDVANGDHTACSGHHLFRTYPGRLAFYPAVATTCCGIFFGGGSKDMGIAAICGLVAGLIDYFAGNAGHNTAKIMIDALVGMSSGVICGLTWEYWGQDICFSAILLGTLYWFFYGTAFVLGLLEIVAGELETGVTRFVAVSVKTFVLCMGAGFGLMMTLNGKSHTKWFQSQAYCTMSHTDEGWSSDSPWRIPLYLLCSMTVLGQYRFPIRHWWRALIVQLVAYEVQFEWQAFMTRVHGTDVQPLNNMDYASANTLAVIGSVFAATLLSKRYFRKALHNKVMDPIKNKDGCYECCENSIWNCGVSLGLLRASSAALKDILVEFRPSAECGDGEDAARRSSFNVAGGVECSRVLTENEEKVLIEAIIEDHPWNIWALLMPAVYQLVPGAIVAKLWFNSLFTFVAGQDTESSWTTGSNTISGWAQLMVLSTSLALGLILGMGIVRLGVTCFNVVAGKCGCRRIKLNSFRAFI